MAARDDWLALLRRSMHQPTAPADDRYWAPALETCSRAELRAIQGEKLALAVRYLYEHSRFYRERLDARRLRPADVRSVDDLGKLPLATKQEMAADQAPGRPGAPIRRSTTRRGRTAAGCCLPAPAPPPSPAPSATRWSTATSGPGPTRERCGRWACARATAR
jgi:hypothetical protein